MNLPIVTVLMPVFNGMEYLAEAINSILQQSFKNFELLIINDGSTDGSIDLIKSFTDTRIRIIQNEKNYGLVYTRNRGLKEARGKYIAMLDCDDLALSNRLSLQVNFLNQNPNYGLVGSQILMIDAGGQQVGKEDYNAHSDLIPSILFFNNYLAQSSVMIRQDLIKNYEYQKEYPPAEDYDLWVRLSRVTKIKILQKPLVKYRLHTNNVSVKKAQEGAKAVKKILYNQLQELGLQPNATEFALHTTIANFEFEKSKAYLNNCAVWLMQVYEANLTAKIFPNNSFQRVLLNRFALICGNSGLGLWAINKFLSFPLLTLGSFNSVEVLKLFVKAFTRR